MSEAAHDKANINIRLREVEPGDIPTLFEHQSDPDANRMAAVNPRDLSAFGAHWTKILKDPSVCARVILADDVLVGQISCFKSDGQNAVGYWIAKEHWGRGIATRALALLLDEVTARPILARVATHNVASIRVLERCGFAITGYQWSPGDGRFCECREALMVLT